MQTDLFSGVWIFDPTRSTLASPPRSWVQHVRLAEGRLRIREEIERESGRVVVEVDAHADGSFYPVSGSTFVDEISYQMRGSTIMGVGRKAGAISLRESIDYSMPDAMRVSLVLTINGREIALGMAYFMRCA